MVKLLSNFFIIKFFMKEFKKIIFALIFFIYSIFFIYGLNNYSETKYIYILFSIVFFSLLISGFYKPKSYGYLFLTIFLFLGFWSKLTLHLIFKYPYVEAVGFFYEKNSSMDSVLVISIIGALAVILGNIIYRKLNIDSTIYIKDNYLYKKTIFCTFYDKYKRYIYC